MSNQKFHFAYAQALEQVGEPEDVYEADRLYWVPTDEVLRLVKEGSVPGCPTMFGLLYAHAFGYLDVTR